MRIGKFVFNEHRYNGYKLVLDWPGVVSIAHDNTHTMLPWSDGSSVLTVCFRGGVNGGGRIWRFENYRRRERLPWTLPSVVMGTAPRKGSTVKDEAKIRIGGARGAGVGGVTIKTCGIPKKLPELDAIFGMAPSLGDLASKGSGDASMVRLDAWTS